MDRLLAQQCAAEPVAVRAVACKSLSSGHGAFESGGDFPTQIVWRRQRGITGITSAISDDRTRSGLSLARSQGSMGRTDPSKLPAMALPLANGCGRLGWLI
jgi:hypothetical protein